MEFWTLFFLLGLSIINDSLIVRPTGWPYNYRCPDIHVAHQPYIHTWVVNPPTNQPNPIQKKMTINKIQLFDRDQTKHSNVSSNSSIIPSLLICKWSFCLLSYLSYAINASHFIANDVEDIRQVILIPKKGKKNLQLMFQALEIEF